jgi:hypothetical protein
VGRGKRRPKGWFLAHNHADHLAYTKQGENGFRYFWIAPAKARGFKVCKCGWRPDWGRYYSAKGA